MILIVNRGGCPSEAIQLIGYTNKDGVKTVGRFGSGTAYAVALALRNNISVSISSEDSNGAYTMEAVVTPVQIGVDIVNRVEWKLKRAESLFGRLLRRGARRVDTSFTDQLGSRDWTGAFPIVREFLANARDADLEGWRVFRDIACLDEYISQAKAAGYSTVTIIKIEDPTGACEAILDNFDEHFRWDRSGIFGAIYEKPELSPVKIFVRGVRCPWPSEKTPMSLYDYSLEIDLNEARSIKDPISATTAITYLWHTASVEMKSRMLARVANASQNGLTGRESAIVELSVNEYVGRHSQTWKDAWKNTFDDAPARRTDDAEVCGAITFQSSAFVSYVGACGIPTVASRSKSDAAPSSANTAWVEIHISEIASALEALKTVGVAPMMVAALTRLSGKEVDDVEQF